MKYRIYAARSKFAAAAIAVIAYFALAYYFKISHVEAVPKRDGVAVIHRVLPTATPGVFFAHMWLPTYVTRVTVYEHDVSIGYANAVYDDPNRTLSLDGKRWKYVEFNTKGEQIRRWIVFASPPTR